MTLPAGISVDNSDTFAAMRKLSVNPGSVIMLYCWAPHDHEPAWQSYQTADDDIYCHGPSASVQDAAAAKNEWGDAAYWTLYAGITTIGIMSDAIIGFDNSQHPPHMTSVTPLVTIWPHGAIEWLVSLHARTRGPIDRLSDQLARQSQPEIDQ